MQTRNIVLARQRRLRVLFFDGSKCRRRGEQGLHPVLGNHAPEGTRIRGHDRLAFVQNRCTAVDQRTVDDIGVAHDPADIGCGPVNLARLHVIDGAHAVLHCDRMTTVLAHHSLGFAGGAGGVKYVERVATPDRNAIDRLRFAECLLPVHIPAGLQAGPGLRAL